MTIQLSTSKLSIGQVFAQGLRFFAATFNANIPLFALFLIWLVSAGIFTNGVIIGEGARMAQPASLFWTDIIVFILVNVVFFSATYYKMYSFALGTVVTTLSAFKVGLKKLPVMVLAAIVSLVSVSILLMIPGLYLLVFIKLLKLRGFLVFLGLAPFVIPTIYLSLVIALFYPTMVLENFANPLKVFWEFCQLIWGNWWRSMIVNIVPSVVLSGVIVLLNYFAGYLGMKHGLMYVGTVIQACCSAFFLFISAGIFITQINDLKVRRQEKIAAQQFLKNAKNNASL